MSDTRHHLSLTDDHAESGDTDGHLTLFGRIAEVHGWLTSHFS
jgi:hypothetical protein